MAATAAAPGDPETPQRRVFCPVCRQVSDEFEPGPGGRPAARCPRCRSLERQRFLALLLRAEGPRLSNRTLLDIAPSSQITRVVTEVSPRRTLRIDLDPAADGRSVDVLASVTALPFPDASVDALLCYHVLEHVPDDATAMRELARVLAPDGLGLLQVPFRAGAQTDEDPDADIPTRISRFGQADHVRYYGEDFEDRLQAGGLAFDRVAPGSFLGPELAATIGVAEHEFVWFARRADAPPPDLEAMARAVRLTLVADLIAGATALEQRLAHERRKVEVLHARVDRACADRDKARELLARERVESATVRGFLRANRHRPGVRLLLAARHPRRSLTRLTSGRRGR